MNIHKEYRSELSVEVLFKAWVSPEMTIEPVTRIECNPVTNGNFTLCTQGEYGEGVMNGKFKLVSPNHKLVYSWKWTHSDEETEVTVVFNAGADGTLIEVNHTGFDSNESRDLHDAGWDHYFNNLQEKIRQVWEH